MGKRYYLAYGSNLSGEAMAVRCPDAKMAGTGVLEGWKLVFKTHADIVPCEGKRVPVLVWEISERDEKNLDRYESYPRYYVKRDFDLTMTDFSGKQVPITAMAYVMTEGHGLCEPLKSYVEILVEGYRRFGFDEKPLREALLECRKGR